MTRSNPLARRRRALVSGLVQGAWRRMQQAGAITAASPAGRRFAAFGPHSMMGFPPGAVYGERWIEVGDECMIAELVTLCVGLPGQDHGPAPMLRVGDRCVIGRGSHIVAHSSIEIGDDVFTGPYAYITDQNHSYADPEMPVGRQWPVNSAVRIGSGSWLGTGAVILPGARIGRNAVVAAGAVVRGEVPDFAVVGGVPARVIRRYVPGEGWLADPPGLLSGDVADSVPGGLTGIAAAKGAPGGAAGCPPVSGRAAGQPGRTGRGSPARGT